MVSGKIGVLLGGDSQEREVSLDSGQAVYESLKNQNVDVIKIDICNKKKASWLEQIQNIDFAFIALHGRGGEDGKIQALLELLEIPYTGSSVTASAVAMNKLLSKQIWTANSLPTPEYVLMDEQTNISKMAAKIGFPMMIKPAHEGSSIGISKVNGEQEIDAAFALARKFDPIVIAEQWINGKEYTASIVAKEVLPLIRLQTPREFYDYQAKYKLDDTLYFCPCGLEQEIEQQVQQLAKKAFASIGCIGWGRVDFMLDEKQQPWLIELNTVPGLTSHSLVPMAAKQAGKSFDQLIISIIKAAQH
ncbi:MAG: D-alanine--D-alanine ligase [Pseudomonadota bacterium]